MPTEVDLVTPERVLYSGEAEFVVLTSDGGEIMFLPNHAPYVGAVDISLVRIARSTSEEGSGDEVRVAVHGGFVHVAANKISILASVAELGDEIDVERARRALEAAESAAASEEKATAEHREIPDAGGRAGSVPVPDDERAAEEQGELSPTMMALLYPDDPSVALRRAGVRLLAAGEGDTAASQASH